MAVESTWLAQSLQYLSKDWRLVVRTVFFRLVIFSLLIYLVRIKKASLVSIASPLNPEEYLVASPMKPLAYLAILSFTFGWVKILRRYPIIRFRMDFMDLLLVHIGSLPKYRIYDLGFLANKKSLLSFRNWYFSLVSDSLLISEINIVVLPPSRIMGYLPISDPVNSFELGIFNRLCSSIILYSKVVFFIFVFFIRK